MILKFEIGVFTRSVLSFLVIAVLCITPISSAIAQPKPSIISLDSCADQVVLHLADQDQILALSPNATLPFSYYGERAKNFPSHENSVEVIIGLKPDVALRTGVGGFDLERMLKRLKVKTVSTGLSQTLDGVMVDVATFGTAMGQEVRSEQLLADMKTRIATVKANAGNYSHLKAMYLSPGGTTTGEGTFVGQVIAMSGLSNLMHAEFETWGQIDLEALATNPPDVIVGSFFDAQVGNADSWRFARHPVVQKLMEDVLFIDVPSKYLACPQWMMLEAVELIQNELNKQP